MKGSRLLLMLLLAGALFGCSQALPNEQESEAVRPDLAQVPEVEVSPSEPPKPVTLNVSSQGASTMLDEPFQNVVNEQLAKKYPHIQLEFHPESAGTSLDALITAGAVPDLVVTFNGNLASLQEKGLAFDMSPLMREHDINIERFEPNYIQDVLNASDMGELYGLPINVNYHALYYNLDIFDKYGASYPSEGMTWDGVIERARIVARTEGDTRYRGLDPGLTVIWMSQPLSIAAIDPATDKATVSNDAWKRVFELAKSIYDIPGNEMISERPKDQFMKSKTLAMLLDLNILTQLTQAEQEGLRWDVTQYPSYPEKPDTYGNASVYVMIASKTSPHPKEATQVIDLISSEETQLALSRIGRLSPLRSEAVKAALGADHPTLKDKNLPSIFLSLPVPYPVASTYRGKAESILISKFNEYLGGTVDVNTVLKQAEEAINQMVAAEKSQ